MQKTLFTRLAGIALVSLTLAACAQMSNDERRALGGAAVGAGVAAATDESIAAGAAIGAAGGALCDDVGICQ